MKLTKWMAATALFLSFGVVGCTEDRTDEVSQLTRDTDEVSVAYNKDATTRVSVRVPGAWSASAACKDAAGEPTATWLRLDPAEGAGNGRDYQWITVIADRNVGAKREAVITIVDAARGTSVDVTVAQEDGTFEVKQPELSGKLKSDSESKALLAIAYSKAKGGEPVEIDFSFDGDSRGLAIKDYSGTIESEGDGKIELPITGTPTDIGVVKLNMKMVIEGKTIFDDVVPLNIQSSNFIFSMDFGKFVWGSDLMANKSGVTPNPSGGTAGKEYNGTEPGIYESKVGADGTNDVFNTMTILYRTNRDVADWSGARVYEHPGYIKLGTGSGNGWIQTPKMSQLTSAPQTVVVSFDVSLYDGADDKVIFSAEGAGEIEGSGEVSLPTFSGWANAKWTNCTFVVNGATSATSFKWTTTKTDGKGRFQLDNISVMASAVKERTEPLDKVDTEQFVYSSGADWIKVDWAGVPDATGYELKLAPQENPSFVNKVVVSADEGADGAFSHQFDELKPGFYLIDVVALYEPNPEFNSEKVSILLGTEGYVAGPLKTPEVTASSTAYTVTPSWKAVSGATGYKAVLKQNGAQIGEQTVKSEQLSATFGDLTPDSDYAVSVQALYESNSEYDSKFSEDVAIRTRPLLTKPVAQLYSGFDVTHNMAVFEWNIDASEQEDTQASLQILNGSTKVYDFSKWSMPIAGFPYRRFVVGGLQPQTTYTVRVKRVTRDASKFGDSDWGEFQFTTTAKADHSDCLFYADFNEHWWGGNGEHLAFGMWPNGAQNQLDLTGDLTKFSYSRANPVNNMNNPNNGVGKNPADYHRLFFSQWDAAKMKTGTEDYVLRAYMTAGLVKFGTGSGNGYLAVPLTQLTAPTTVVLTFRSSPYVEPNRTSNSLENPYVIDGKEGVWVRLRVADGARIVEADGMTVAAADQENILLKHQLPTEYGADKLRTYRLTEHRVVIENVTATTLIQLYTRNEKSVGNRVWIDDVIVKRK